MQSGDSREHQAPVCVPFHLATLSARVGRHEGPSLGTGQVADRNLGEPELEGGGQAAVAVEEKSVC